MEKKPQSNTQEAKQETSHDKPFQFWLSTTLSIAALVISIFSSVVAFQQSQLEAIFQPLNFNVSRGEQSVYYEIKASDGTTYKIPAYETNISPATGAYQEFAQIYYDGTAMEFQFADLNVLESGKYIIHSTGQIPSANHVLGEKAYDYCFIHTISASGERNLWLIYYELDPLQKTVKGPFKANDTILLLLNQEEESSKMEMLRNYQKLYEMVNRLP